MNADLAEAAASLRRVRDAARAPQRAAAPVAAADAADAVIAALRGTILANRITVRSDTGRTLAFVARDRRVLALVDPQPTAGAMPGEGAAAEAQDVAGRLWEVLQDAREVTIERCFLSHAPVAGQDGVSVRNLTEAIASQAARGVAPADPVEAMLWQFGDVPQARITGDAVGVTIPGATAADDAAWFRDFARAYAAASAGGEDSLPLMLMTSGGSAPRSIAAVRAGEDVVLLMPAPGSPTQKLELALSRLGRPAFGNG